MEARQPLETAREIFEELNDLPALGSVLGTLGRIYQVLGPTSKAIQLREKYLALQRDLTNWFEISLGCELLADTLIFTGDLKKAKVLIEEGELIFQQINPGGYRQGLAFQSAQIDCWLGNYYSVKSILADEMRRRRKFEAEGTIAYHNLYQGYFLSLLGQAREARKLLEEGMRLFKTSRSNRDDLNHQQTFLLELTHTCIVLGEFYRARQYIDEFRHLYELDYYQPKLYLLLGTMSLLEDEENSSVVYFLKSLRIANKMGFRLQELLALEGYAWAITSNGQVSLASRLLGASSQFREFTGAQVYPRDKPRYEKTIGDLKQNLGEKGFQSSWMDGYQTGFEQSINDVITQNSNLLEKEAKKRGRMV